MRKLSYLLLLVSAIFVSYEFGYRHIAPQTDAATARHVLYWVDPMHPSYKSDKPGIAPDCGMPLVPVYAQDHKNAPVSPVTPSTPGIVTIDVATQQLTGIRVAEVTQASITRSTDVVGRVTPEDTRVYTVNSGVDGFVRETYEDSVGTHVSKDQKLASYYAPDFLAAASGFLAATERVPGSVGKDGARFSPNFGSVLAKEGVKSIQGYTDRLRDLGMSEVQIKRMADSRELPESIDVVAPVDGFILNRFISAGQHFDHNMEFYRIADISRVWVIAEVDEQDAPLLHPGGLAKINVPGQRRQSSGRVTDSLPQSVTAGGTVKFRLEVDNPSFLLRPDMLVNVELPVRLPSALTVPLDALVDSGNHTRVYIEQRQGIFEPREVETGWRSGGQAEIVNGLQAGDRVVVAATFLVDSESRLRAAQPSAQTDSTLRSGDRAPEHVLARMVKNPDASTSSDHRDDR